MISQTVPAFWKEYNQLPVEVREQARESFLLFEQNPYHNSLYFKQVHPKLPVYSARVTLHYRVLGYKKPGIIRWGWIGPHPEYERIIKNPARLLQLFQDWQQG